MKETVTVEVVDSVLSADLDALEATLTRYGFNVRPAEIRAFVHGQLAPRWTARACKTCGKSR